jgi:nicotinate-nucleotide--dimethylbenzimidazole phosphoribosyltransferase
MSDPRAVLRHVVESIGQASRAHAEAAAAAVAGAGAPMLERVARGLAAAQHRPRPRGERRLVVVAGDHGAGDPGIALGADHPTVIAAHAIAAGTAALAQVARSSRTPIVLVDAGVAEPSHMPDVAIRVGRGATHDLLAEPAMTIVDALLGLEAGIALAMSLAEPAQPTDGSVSVLAVGALGVGSEVAAAALTGAFTGSAPTRLGDALAEEAGRHGAALAGGDPLELLASLGGRDTAVLAGLILGAASIHIAVILDGQATGAAALVAAALAPNVPGFLIAAHRGSGVHPVILAHLGLSSIYDVGLGHGDGTGAAMLLPLVDSVAGLAGSALG